MLSKSQRPIIKPLVFSALITAPVIAVFWYSVGISIFGFVSGPDPNLALFLTYMLKSLPPAALFFAFILKWRLKKMSISVGFKDSLLISTISLSFIQISEGIITLYQFGNDTVTFLGGLSLSFCSAILLTDYLRKKNH